MTIKREQCIGCHDNFYNTRGDGLRCWLAKTGKIKTRYQLHYLQVPTAPGAYTQVRKPSCYRQVNHCVFHDTLPSFVKTSEVTGYKSGR